MTDLMLVLNAAEGRVQALLLRDGTLVAAQDWSAPSQGTEILTPLLVEMFRHTGHTPEKLSRIACVAGPGSFTGLRLVLATASALRRATGAPVAALNYLQVLAASLPAALLVCHTNSPYRVRVLTHARRGLVHGQDFFLHGAGAPDHASRPLSQADGFHLPEAIGLPTMLDLIGACASPLPDAVMGSGVTRNLDFLQANVPGTVHLLSGHGDQASPRALAAVALALPAEAWVQKDLEPLYLRPCDAVDNLSSIAAKRNDNPDMVHAELRRLLSAPPQG